MAFEKHYDQSEPITHQPCIHLRSKEMYVNGELALPKFAAGDTSHHYWCNQSQHVLGPDSQQVDVCKCCPERQCYRLTH